MTELLLKGYFLADVRAAEDKIRGAVPDAIFSHVDYGFGLRVWRPGLDHEFIVFQPFRPNLQPEIQSDVDKIIASLLDPCPEQEETPKCQ